MKNEKRQEDKIMLLKNTVSALVSETELLKREIDFYKEILRTLKMKSEELTPREFKQFFDEDLLIEDN